MSPELLLTVARSRERRSGNRRGSHGTAGPKPLLPFQHLGVSRAQRLTGLLCLSLASRHTRSAEEVSTFSVQGD
jgi:hypothetical protein